MENIIYIILAVVGFLVVMQLYIRLTAFLKKGKEIKGLTGVLGKKINAGEKNVVYFYTPSCGACKPMTPIIEVLTNEFENLHKANLAKDIDIGRAFGVMGTPALIAVENSRIQSYVLGARTEHFIRKMLV